MLHQSDNPNVLNSADFQIRFGKHPNHHRPCDRIKFRVFSSIFSNIFSSFHMGEDFSYEKQRLKFSKLISRYGPQRYFDSYNCSESQFLLSFIMTTEQNFENFLGFARISSILVMKQNFPNFLLMISQPRRKYSIRLK